MRRKAAIWLICLMQIITLLAAPVMETEAAQVNAAKKIISVVYDDSGSMWDANDSWASANYAMQAFAALLNPQDEMYITYMSDVGTAEEGAKQVNLQDPQAAVNTIKADSAAGAGTPLESVEIAMDKLKSVKETDENAQYWLIILTDGAMSPNGAKAKDLQSCLNSYKGTTMSNGSEVLIYYMGIGSAQTINDDPGKGFNSVMAGTDIVPALSEIANKVSGRMKFDSSDITQIDGKTVKLHSDVPLYTISVFSQNSKAQVVSAKGEIDFNIDRNVNLESPNNVLYGNAAVVDNGTSVIPPGDYTITFSEDVSLDDTVFMFQLAIEMKPEITRNGVKIDDPGELVPGDRIDIELIPTNPETGEVIEESKLPAGITWGVSYSIDGTEIKSSGSRTLSGVTVEIGENKITCTMQVPDYVPTVQNITFTLVNPVVYGIWPEHSDDDRYPRNNLGLDNCEGTPDKFYITGDGVPLTKSELGKMKLEVVDVTIDDSNLKGFLETFGFKSISPKLQIQDDGSFVLYPGRSILPAFILQAGIYEVTVALSTDETVTAIGSFEVYPQPADWIDLIWLLILLLIIIYILFILFGKAKFEGQTLKVDVYKPFGGDGGGKLQTGQCDEIVLHKYTLATFLPTPASTYDVPGLGIRVISDGNSGVYITTSALKGFKKAGPSSINPINNYQGVVNSLKETETLIQAAKSSGNNTISLGGTPYYFSQGNKLYKVTIQ